MKEIQDSSTMKSCGEKWYEKRASIIFAWLGHIYCLILATPLLTKSLAQATQGNVLLLNRFFNLVWENKKSMVNSVKNMYVDTRNND